MNTEQEYIERAEDMAETAQKLAEQYEEDNKLVNEPTLRKLPVIGTEDEDDQYQVNLVVSRGPDSQETVSVPWPDDTTDASEPLVRLANFYDVGIDDITELKEIWVYTETGDNHDVVIPPEDMDSFMKNPKRKTLVLNEFQNKLVAEESITTSLTKISIIGVASIVLMYALATSFVAITTPLGFAILTLLFMNIYYIVSKITDLSTTIDNSVGKMEKI